MSFRTAALADVALINPRRSAVDRASDAPTSFVPMEAVSDVLGEVVRHDQMPFSKVKKGYTYFEDGDVIFAKISPCMQNGKHAVVGSLIGGFGFGSTEFHVIRPTHQITSDWIHLFLRRRETAEAAVKTFKGAVGQQRVPASFLEYLELPVPPVEDQRRIAARLKAQLAEVETARQAAQAQVRNAARLRASLLDAAFNNLPDWQPIAASAKLQSGYAFKSENFKTAGVRLLRNANILPGQVYWDDTVFLAPEEAPKYPAYVLQAGDVLISLDRPVISTGIKVARITPADLPALLLQRVGRFVPRTDDLDLDFLFAFLNSSRFIEAISGHDQSVGVPHISPGQVEAVDMPALPLAAQRHLVSRLQAQLAEANAIAQAAAAQLAHIEQLPPKLLAQAFDA